MNPDQIAMVKRGLDSDFWEWYTKDVLEPEYEQARGALLRGRPLKPEDVGLQSFYQGVFYILEKLKKNPETWIDISNFHRKG